jgi:hypothetical protein
MIANTDHTRQLADFLNRNQDIQVVYSARPALVDAASLALNAFGAQPVPALTVVTESPDGTSVAIAVGVTGERPASQVCRDLHDAIETELITAGATLPLSISVRIASIA